MVKLLSPVQTIPFADSICALSSIRVLVFVANVTPAMGLLLVLSMKLPSSSGEIPATVIGGVSRIMAS